MAIRPIENQGMIQRTAEYAKEHSVQNRKNELMHDYMAAQRRVEEEHQSKSVSKLEDKSDPKIRRDREGRGGGGGSPGGSGQRKPGKEKQEPDDGSGHIIDIRL